MAMRGESCRENPPAKPKFIDGEIRPTASAAVAAAGNVKEKRITDVKDLVTPHGRQKIFT